MLVIWIDWRVVLYTLADVVALLALGFILCKGYQRRVLAVIYQWLTGKRGGKV